MSYSKSVYVRAREILERRRSRALSEQQDRHKEVTDKIPEIIGIEHEISQSVLDATRVLGDVRDTDSFLASIKKRNLDAQKRREDILEQNGYPRDYLKAEFTCTVCKDKGYVEGRRCECYKKLLRNIAYSDLCGDFPLDGMTFESFRLDYYPKAPLPDGKSSYRQMSEIYNFCKKYANDFGLDSNDLFMHGATGLGKTHLSLAIAREVINKGYGVIYASAQNLMNRLEKEHFGNYGDESSLDAVLDCDLLILDDLGTEFTTSFSLSCIYNILNTRLLKKLPTIISTNLTIDEIEHKYAQRISSRIIGKFISLEFIGRDIRQINR